ncbi:MAG: hypothetical protein A2015_05770 [Spirochaetes bacterium GWF1_31_7]|nr:MAG: hypothetical protein A2Y30_00180 [Spirochaetes bacterium GWE1_32_154]OHD47198.1 MAG: hypothetical protein A2Y29_10765 [Spirochaetes bacterium GWE2_31_10]OHD48931.1 MAG: hypothetical protein A2015_05770 [Spirochaetes bacterium GWF1_31_7]OHD81841.1 MAG: hypothetical protein A2355_13945 [Spirochaetes bacterium RIFOXYB1_FULL_32_8]HBD92594.1 hypothetical protein [Spirochaetia bacterium]
MKNRISIQRDEEIKIPEVKIHGIWKKIALTIRKIPHLFWIGCIVLFLIVIIVLMPRDILKAFWISLKTQKIIFALLIFFVITAISLLISVGQRIDVWVFMYFNMHGKRTFWFDRFMLALTQLGNFIFALILAFIVFTCGDHVLAYEIILGISSLGLVVQIMKVLIHRTRPYIKLENIRIVGSRASGRSFPSGHTGQVFLIATLLLQYYHLNILIGIVLYTIALFVGITRIYVGMHYPRDVIGGAILGTAWGLLGVIINSCLPYSNL